MSIALHSILNHMLNAVGSVCATASHCDPVWNALAHSPDSQCTRAWMLPSTFEMFALAHRCQHHQTFRDRPATASIRTVHLARPIWMWHSFASMMSRNPASNSSHSYVPSANRLLCRRQNVDLVLWSMCPHSVCVHFLFSARDSQWCLWLSRCRSSAIQNRMRRSSHFRRLPRVELAILLLNYPADWVCNRFQPALLHPDPTKNVSHIKKTLISTHLLSKTESKRP